MNKHPKITIGITCYNASDSIDRAINSALAQTYLNTEIIVVDDCSTDTSCKVISKHKNVKLIQHEQNTGPGGARNTLLNAANGEFLAFFDDDDESHPDRLQKQYDRITQYETENNTSLIACYASGTRIYPNGHTLKLQAIGHKPLEPNGEAMASRILYFGNTPDDWCNGGTPSCALMARTSTFKEAGGFDPAFRRVEDLDFAIRLALKTGHFIGCPEDLFTQHATDGNDKSHDKNLAAELQLAKKHKDFLKRKNRYTYARLWPRLRYHHFRKDYFRMGLTLATLLLRHPIAVTKHALTTGPKRLKHEKQIGHS